MPLGNVRKPLVYRHFQGGIEIEHDLNWVDQLKRKFFFIAKNVSLFQRIKKKFGTMTSLKLM